MATKTMLWLTFMLIIMHSICIKAHFSWSRKTIYVPEKERTETIPKLSPSQCIEQCQLHRFCKAVGMNEEDHEEDRKTDCFLLSRKPNENDKEKKDSDKNLSVMYEDEEYSYTIDYYVDMDKIIFPVHGSWGVWTQFTQCNTTCGTGYEVRGRKCDDPTPMNGGFNCSGSSQEYKKCKVKECPVDGGYSMWSVYGLCSKTCGLGQQTRTRLCDNPTPQYGGKNCDALGPSSETLSCNTCPVHGGYSTWSSYGLCSKTCGGPGTQTRTRNCDSPSPEYGGNNCTSLGQSTETQSCDMNMTCPVHGGWDNWSNFGTCSKTCGPGKETRTRTCNNPVPAHGGDECDGDKSEEKDCLVESCPPVDGGYSTWSSYEPCSKTCGGSGTQTRTRKCVNPSPAYGGRDCTSLGPSTETQSCNIDITCPAPVHGGWDNWSNFGTCSKTCGPGKETRTRTCNNPVPAHGGDECDGDKSEEKNCDIKPCPPVNGDYSAWSSWGKCTCVSAEQSRKRKCNNPSPKYGGKDCTALGKSAETRSCKKPSDWKIKTRGNCKSVSEKVCKKYEKYHDCRKFQLFKNANVRKGCYVNNADVVVFNTKGKGNCSNKNKCICRP